MKGIISLCAGDVYAVDGKLPHRSREDLAHFLNMTRNKTCIVGRKTYDSMRHVKRHGRTFVVVTNDEAFKGESSHEWRVLTSAMLEEALKENAFSKETFVIGGGQIYMLLKDHIKEWHVTRPLPEFYAKGEDLSRMGEEFNEYLKGFGPATMVFRTEGEYSRLVPR